MITVKVNAPTATIILDRPDRCNALNRKMVEKLSEALDDLRQEKKVRGIVIAGSGPHFCTGLDLHELKETASGTDPMQSWFSYTQALQRVIEQILQLPKPVIAAVDGSAMATGFGLVVACDMVVASHRATFSVPAARLGLVSGLVVPLLAFRCGASTASRLVLGGDELSATEAKSLGLVGHVVDSENVWVRSSTWIDSMSDSAAESLQLTKRVLNEMVGESLMTMLSSGSAAMATSFTTEAAEEGLTAFSEGRKPEFPR